MALTGTETGLIAAVVGLIAAGGGAWANGRNKVTVNECILKHRGEEKAHKTALEDVKNRLERIEHKLDKLNGGGDHD